MKMCNVCNNIQKISCFYKNKSAKDGLYSVCKLCKNKKNTKYKNMHIDAEKNRNYLWYLNNKDHKSEYYKEYYSNNKYKYHAAYIRRLSQIKRATLLGYRQETDIIYRDRPKGYHVDHIVPLQGKEVSGLHVPWNLQYLTKEENLRKSNKLIADIISSKIT